MAEQQTNNTEIQVNIDYLRQQRLHICMPCYGGQLTERAFMSFIKFGNTCRQLGIDYTVETMTNESLITRARNTMTAKFLNTKDSTHLLFVDADIGWEPWHVLLLLNHDVDVVGGLYPMKSMPIQWVVNGVENGDISEDGHVQEVSKTGTGFLLIKRHVFEKLNEHPAVVPFKNDIGIDPELDQYMKTYFDTDVREGRYYSEDWTFCENWRDLGGKIWIDKRILLTHTGTYVFDYKTQAPLYEALKSQHDAGTLPKSTVDPSMVGKVSDDTQERLQNLPPERQSAKVLAKTKPVAKDGATASAQDS
jgi:hypothetical protein